MFLDLILRNTVRYLQGNVLVDLMLISIVMDMIFGSLRALREHRLNSSAGIDGAIRKVGMIVAIVCLSFVDSLIPFDLLHFVPRGIKELFNIKNLTIMELFALLFLLFETLSVLKNMAFAGLPVRTIWEKVHNFLSQNTNEILDLSEIDLPGQEKEGHNKIVHLDGQEEQTDRENTK